MIKGLYISSVNLDLPSLSGVQQKIDGHLESFRFHGFDVDLLSSRSGYLTHSSASYKISGRYKCLGLHPFPIHNAVYKYLESLSENEYRFVYIRYQGAYPGFAKSLSAFLASRPEMPVLLEFPTWPFRSERRGLKSHIKGILADWDLPRLKSSVDRVVTFSGQRHIIGLPTIQIQNGVSVSHHAVSPPYTGGAINILGLANLSFWHGYDRIIQGLAAYKALGGLDVHFHVVGNGSHMPYLVSLASSLGLNQDWVTFHGALCGSQLDEIFSCSHIGVGSIGYHRLNRDTTDLKIREYCSRGIPFVQAQDDPDFPDDIGFFYKVPSTDEPVDIFSLVGWFVNLSPDIGSRMHSYSAENLSWNVKLKPVLDWLRLNLYSPK